MILQYFFVFEKVGCKKCVKFEDSNGAIPRNLQAVLLYWLHTILKILSNTWKFVTFYDEKVKQLLAENSFFAHRRTFVRQSAWKLVEQKFESSSIFQPITDHYRVPHGKVDISNWFWRVEICKLDFVWRLFWNF